MEYRYKFLALCTVVAWAHVPMHAERAYTITSQSGFLLTDCEKQKHSKISEKELAISISDTAFTVNEVTIKPRQLIIESVEGIMAIDKVPHQGSVVIAANGAMELIAETIPEVIEKKDVETLVDADSVLSNSTAEVKATAVKSHVRVLLTEQPIQETDFRFFSDNGFIVAHSRKDPNKQKIASTELHVTAKKGEFYINSTRFVGDSIIIAPQSGQIEFGGNTYQGVFNVLACPSKLDDSNESNKRSRGQKKKSLLVNSIDVEDYIFAVVRSESWPNWPLEVNKVFAIACRSYVIAMAMRAKKTGLPYHIRNTNKHQRYDGFHTCPIIRQAIEETRGVFLAFNEVPIIAMFDSCCGGVIPAHVDHMNFDDAPYLARDYACTHCQRCKIYSWETTIAAEEFEKLMHGKKKKVGKVRSVKIAKKDKAGLVREVAVRDGKRTHKLSGKEMYSMIKDVKSYCFSVSKNADLINIKGRGYGHHVGLCQWGAREMVRDGWDYKSILAFYYPGTTFMKLG